MSLLKGVVDATFNGAFALYDYGTRQVALVPDGHQPSWANHGFLGIRNVATNQLIKMEWFHPQPADDLKLTPYRRNA